LYCLMECGIVDTSKASQPTNQTNKQECHDFECLLLPLDNNYFAFDCGKLEGSSRLGLLRGDPPLSLFDMLLGVGNLMFPLWFTLSVVLLSSWTWVLPFCFYLGGYGSVMGYGSLLVAHQKRNVI
jgi:hypothetical protein